MKKLIWIGLAFFVVLVGCDLASRDFSLTEDDFSDLSKGTLMLLFDDSELPTKTIAPDPSDMIVERWEIRGSGPSGDSFEDLTNTSGVLTRNGLTPGAWTLRVEAFNAVTGGIMIGAIGGASENTTPFTIVGGQVNTLDVTIIPIIGTGTLGLTLDWPSGSVSNPTVDASLTPYGSTTPETLTFLPDPPVNDIASYTDSVRVAGYYTIMLQLFEDGSTLVWGHLEAVRVIYQQTTSRTFTLNTDAGGLYLPSITFDNPNPVDIAFTYYDPAAPTTPISLPATLSKATSPITLNVEAVPAPSDTGNYMYLWYDDGTPIGTAAPAASDGHLFTLVAADYSLGDHNFTVLINDTANETLSSESFSIEIVN